MEKHEAQVSAELQSRIAESVYELALRMATLALSNRNGIWAFILKNTYRPGLLAGRFNGLVSNPPWLAMSQFAENPYKIQLSERARTYGLKPSGASHLHLELATTHLLHAVDRYLKAGSPVVCLVPGTVFNGQHHAKLRDAKYLGSSRRVPLELLEAWMISAGTFKVRSAVLVGVKRDSVETVQSSSPEGAVLTEDGLQSVSLTLERLGDRTAWVFEGNGPGIAQVADDIPIQGADLMPRPAVCVEVEDQQGSEWRVRTPNRGDKSYFSVAQAKKLKGVTFNGLVAPRFIHRMVQSLNLLPFLLDMNFASIAVPAQKDERGRWELLDSSRIRTDGLTQTARYFSKIDQAMEGEGVAKSLHEKIDEWGKLSKQVFSDGQHLLLNGAGGGLACAACLSFSGDLNLIIDQTLYWSVVPTEGEAWYRAGLINTKALSSAVRRFNPQGELGPRHLHTLPNRIIPPYEEQNIECKRIGELARLLSTEAWSACKDDPRILDPLRPIASRRRLVRNRLLKTDHYGELEDAASLILNL